MRMGHILRFCIRIPSIMSKCDIKWFLVHLQMKLNGKILRQDPESVIEFTYGRVWLGTAHYLLYRGD
jgi:hypothetical protein